MLMGGLIYRSFDKFAEVSTEMPRFGLISKALENYEEHLD